MMRNKALVTAMILWLLPVVGNALGLGDITSKSYLNQPLNAEITLHSLRAGDLEELEVRMADQRDYQRAQIPWQDWMGKVTFSVERNAKGNAFIRMTTAEPIREPFLNFLVKAVWANGRVLKQYTLLIDPADATVPTAPTQQQGVAVDDRPLEEPGTVADPEPLPIEEPPSPVAVEPAPIPDPEPVAATEPRVQPEPEVKQPGPIFDTRPRRTPQPRAEPRQTFSGASEVVVKEGQIAWDIAKQWKGDSNVSVQQVLMAMLEANPHAFVKGNVNIMKKGVVMKAPDLSKLAMSRQQAINEMARQNAAWRSYQQAAAEVTSDVPVAINKPAPSEVPVETVAPTLPKDPEKPAFEVRSASDNMREKLKSVNESISSMKDERKDLNTTLASLKEQKQSLKSLIGIQSEMLAKMSKEKPPEERSASEAKNEPPKPTEPQIDTSVIDTGKPTDDTQVFENEENSYLALLANPKVLAMAVGVFLVILIISWMWKRHGAGMDEFQESILANDGANTSSELTQTMAAGGGFSSNNSIISDFSSGGLGGIQSEVSVMDPLAEADVYLAYGRFQHAEELIKEAISKEPNRLEYKSKLLEIYSAMKEQSGFLSVANELHQATGGSGPLWQQAESMGKALCPDSPLFGGAGGGGAAPSAGGQDEFGLDQTFDFGDTAALGQDDTMDFSNNESPNMDETMTFNFNDGDATAGADNSGDNTMDFNFGDSGGGMDTTVAGGGLDFNTDTQSAPAGNDLEDTNVIDFNFSGQNSSPSPLEETAILQPGSDESANGFDMSDGGLDFNVPDSAPATEDTMLNFQTFSEGTHDVAPVESNTMDFDMESTHILGGGSGGFGDMDEDTLFSNTEIDEVGTKLDLARAYIDMGDSEGARSILGEVIEEGNNNQKMEATELLEHLG